MQASFKKGILSLGTYCRYSYLSESTGSFKILIQKGGFRLLLSLCSIDEKNFTMI
jgi:hypothetical protein